MKTEENNLKMAKGRIATSSTRQTASSKPKFKRFSENERLKAITQEISITLSPCDLLTSIDCNFAAKMKDVSDKESCGSADKGTALDCHNVKDDDDSRQCSRTSDQTQNKMDTGTDSNISDSDFGSPNSGFRPTSFYGSLKQNLSVGIRPIVQNSSVKSGEDHHEVKSKNVCGVKRKHKKQSSSTAVKKKPKTGSVGRRSKGFGKKDKCPLQSASLSIQEDKSHVNRLDNINKATQPGHLTEVNDSVTNGFQCNDENWSEGVITSKQSSQESPESLSDSLVEGFIPLRAKLAVISHTVAISKAESACSEESLLSGPGSVLDGLFLKKKGNEYFFTESIGTSSPNVDQIACEENGINESAEGIATGSGSGASSVVDQNVSLVVNGPGSDLTDNSQSSFTLSMPSPETSESEFGSKLLSTEAESESTSPRGTSPEHQASIKRYFKSIPGPKCKTKLGVNGTVLPAAAESSLETKSRTTPPRKKKAGKRQEQMYLDLGQRDFGHVTCPTCGMVYTRAQPDDEAAHIKHHKSFVSGLRFHGWKNECVLQEYHDGRVIMVGPDDHPLHLKKVEEVRKVVDSELGFVADVTCRRSEVKTFLFIAIKKVVGCAVAVQIDQGYPVLPSPGGSSTLSPEKQIAAWCCSTTPQSAQCGISRIWVHNQYRRKKIATRLLDCVRMNFIYGCIIPRELVAFSDPTPHGKLLAKNYAGTSQFLVFR